MTDSNLPDSLDPAAQDGDAPAAGLQRPREFFHHRRLTRSADREIPDANDKAAKRALAEDSFPIQIKPELDDSFVNKRERVKNSAQNRRTNAALSFQNNVDGKLLEIFNPVRHRNV